MQAELNRELTAIVSKLATIVSKLAELIREPFGFKKSLRTESRAAGPASAAASFPLLQYRPVRLPLPIFGRDSIGCVKLMSNAKSLLGAPLQEREIEDSRRDRLTRGLSVTFAVHKAQRCRLRRGTGNDYSQ